MNAFIRKRKIQKNIIPGGRPFRVFRLVAVILPLFLVMSFLVSFTPQEGKNSPKKAEKMRAKKEKEAKKHYEKDVKRHMDNQSKETKKMMKKAKKSSKKNSPVKPTSGKKCT